MAERPRHSDETVVASGSASVEAIIESRSTEPLAIDTLVVDYNNDGSSVATTVEIHEAPADAVAADLDASTRRKTVYLGAGGEAKITGLSLRDVHSDLVVLPDGNQDAEIAVYAGGYHVTSTREGS